MPAARPPSSGRADEIAVPSDGMNASAMPVAAMSEAGRTSAAKLPFAWTRAEARHAAGEEHHAGDDRELGAEPRDHAGRHADHQHHDRDGHRQERCSAVERAVAEHLLEVEVEEEPGRDPGCAEQELDAVGGGEVRRPQDAEPHQRLAAAGLDQRERRQQDHAGEERDAG